MLTPKRKNIAKNTKNVLVTGGAGYIGSHTCKALAKAGFKPIVLDNLVYGHREFVQWGPFEQADIGDLARLNEIIEKYEPMAVLHFAAYAYVGESVEDPAKYYINNVGGTLALLEACRLFEIEKFVFSSTCATYGIPKNLPITEFHPQNPINPYGASKLMIERMLKDYSSAYDLRSVSLRYFNAAGADPERQIGEDHNPETHLIPLVIRAAFNASNPIRIYGTDYPTEDGTAIRDYVHVSDLADAHVAALEYLIEGGDTTVLNLGTGRGYSVRQVIDAVEQVVGHSIPIIETARRSGDPAELVADPLQALRVLKWSANYVDIEQIIETAWHWHCERKNHFNSKLHIIK